MLQDRHRRCLDLNTARARGGSDFALATVEPVPGHLGRRVSGNVQTGRAEHIAAVTGGYAAHPGPVRREVSSNRRIEHFERVRSIPYAHADAQSDVCAHARCDDPGWLLRGQHYVDAKRPAQGREGFQRFNTGWKVGRQHLELVNHNNDSRKQRPGFSLIVGVDVRASGGFEHAFAIADLRLNAAQSAQG